MMEYLQEVIDKIFTERECVGMGAIPGLIKNMDRSQ
jgi:hypothetical protein